MGQCQKKEKKKKDNGKETKDKRQKTNINHIILDSEHALTRVLIDSFIFWINFNYFLISLH